MSNRLVQGVVHQMRDAIDRRVIGVLMKIVDYCLQRTFQSGTTGDYYSVDFGESHDVFEHAI